MELQDEIMSPSMSLSDDSDAPLVDQARAVGAFKKVVLLIAGSAMQRYGEKLQDEQEVLSYIADIVINTYAAESAVLRAQANANGNEAARLLPMPQASTCRRPPDVSSLLPALVSRHERRGHVAHTACGAAPRAQGHSSQRGRDAAPSRRRDDRKGWLPDLYGIVEACRFGGLPRW